MSNSIFICALLWLLFDSRGRTQADHLKVRHGLGRRGVARLRDFVVMRENLVDGRRIGVHEFNVRVVAGGFRRVFNKPAIAVDAREAVVRRHSHFGIPRHDETSGGLNDRGGGFQRLNIRDNGSHFTSPSSGVPRPEPRVLVWPSQGKARGSG